MLGNIGVRPGMEHLARQINPLAVDWVTTTVTRGSAIYFLSFSVSDWPTAAASGPQPARR